MRLDTVWRTRQRTDRRLAIEVDVGIHALNPMLDLGRPNRVRAA